MLTKKQDRENSNNNNNNNLQKSSKNLVRVPTCLTASVKHVVFAKLFCVSVQHRAHPMMLLILCLGGGVSNMVHFEKKSKPPTNLHCKSCVRERFVSECELIFKPGTTTDLLSRLIKQTKCWSLCKNQKLLYYSGNLCRNSKNKEG